jgi:predicted AlkP superfamily pyrophosphatase or phosphodiesterase
MVLPTALSFLGFELPNERYNALSDNKGLRKVMDENSCFDMEKVIVVVADSVGVRQFQKANYLAKIYGKFNGFQLSSVFPTITSTALSSIHMAATPGIHGIFGHKIFFKELGAVVDTLKMSTLSYGARDALVRVGIDVRSLAYCSSPYDLVEEQGIDHVELLEDEIAGTGLSNMIYRKQVAHGFNNLIDAFSTAKHILEQEDRKRVILNVYTGILDSLSHKYGPYSEEYAIGLRFLEENIERLVKSIKDKTAEKTAFLFLSDHGQDSLDPKLEVSFSRDEIDKLNNFMRAPIGKSGRVMHFYSREERKEELLKALREKIGDRGYLITFEEAVHSLVGRTVNLEMSRLRLGDILAILKTGVNAEIRKNDGQNAWEEQFCGSHGSTTLNEITVPFITANVALLKKTPN